MTDVGAILEQAITHHQAGELTAAEPLYRRVLDSHPDQWDALYLLGTALLQSGRFDECIEFLSRVVQAKPDVPDAHNNLGIAYKAVGNWQAATKSFQTAIKTNPDYDQALYNLGSLMEDRGLYADAEKCYRHTLELNPNDQQTRVALGNVLKAQQNWSAAEECYRDILALGSKDLNLYVNFAFVLARQEKLDEAATLYREVLDAHPDFYQVHNSLSYIYERQGKLDAALASAQRALEIQPDYSEAYNNLGTAFRGLHRFDEACDAFQKAISLTDDFPLAEFNRATTIMLQGDYCIGWPGYERRAETLDTPPRTFNQPCWNGKPIPGQTLLIHVDQGFGDALQFARFLTEAKERSNARLILECQPQLKTLLQTHPAVDETVSDEELLPIFDTHIPLTSLPALFNVSVDTIPDQVPYLAPPPELRDELKQLLESVPDDKLKVGFVWQGNTQQARDIVRSCPLELLRPLFELDGIAPFSLQTGDAAEQLQKLNATQTPIDLGTKLQDFSDTAAVIANLNLVITIDTATAHLAGALGAPAWTLLCHTPDWRWLLDRDDSPWYPSMRLLRQPDWGNWPSVITEATSRLKTLIADKL